MHYSLCLAKQVLNELYDARQEQSQQGQRALHGDDRPDRFVFDFEVVSAVDISEVANKGDAWSG
jgi:hypothetical protein